jgi:hypothetical protein
MIRPMQWSFSLYNCQNPVLIQNVTKNICLIFFQKDDEVHTLYALKRSTMQGYISQMQDHRVESLALWAQKRSTMQ